MTFFLPTGPVPSWPSSAGVTINSDSNYFIDKVTWVLDGDPDPKRGNNAQIKYWLNAAKSSLDETIWESVQSTYDVYGWVLVGTASIKRPMLDKDFISIGLAKIPGPLEKLSLNAEGKEYIEESMIKITAQSVGLKQQYIINRYNHAQYVPSNSLVTDQPFEWGEAASCPELFGKNECNGLGGSFGAEFRPY